ncbi:hypothetical protein GKZ28_13145 [Clostridium chromiireducens]|uniref:Uncharacterized protein n=1 Tax=Clostridium chromiireducens TaxID=225345 RepID=A0A964RN31_9CLOT|nr:hypothetical protein [Clostridium chromiireducens]MVX64639.1 hypothetical protein [Clostridium chromiireducens]
MEEYNIIVHENGFDIEAGTIRIKGIEDILIKKSATDIGESLKAYIASRIEGKETIETSNIAKVIEENNDSIKTLEKDAE